MENLIDGVLMIFTIPSLLAIIAGTVIGIIMGAIPGLTGVMAIALLIPLTYYLPPIIVIPALLGVYKGATYGGSIPAILLNTPGTPSAAATVIDGYPLAKMGKAGKALKMVLYASFCGDTFSDLVLILVAAPIAGIAIKFGPTEQASLIIFSLIMVGLIASMGSLVKGLMSAAVGLFLGTIGLDPIAGTNRLDFGIMDLTSGIDLIPFLIGLLAFSEVIKRIGENIDHGFGCNVSTDDHHLTWAEFKRCIGTIFRSSCIGTFLGTMPGIGASTAAFLSYGVAMKTSKNPKEFGHGSLEGVAAPESANNAVCGANLIPLVTLGIPGDLTAAVLIGAFMVHGMQPGPLLMRQQAPLLYGLFIGLLVANVVYLVAGRFFIHHAIKVTRIPVKYLMPVVGVLCIVGSYAVRLSMFDVWVMFFAGILGYLMNKGGFSPPALLISFILSPLLEHNLRRAILISDGSWLVFVQKPISCVLLLLTAIISIAIIISSIRKREDKKVRSQV